MNRIVVWVSGIALVIGAALTAMLVSAAPGDIVYIKNIPAVTLTAGQRTQLGTAIACVYPGAALAQIQEFNCLRTFKAGTNDIYCTAEQSRTVTEDQYATLAVQGAVSGAPSALAGGNVTFMQRRAKTQATGQCLTDLTTFLDTIGVTNTGLLATFKCERAIGSDVSCTGARFVTSSPAAFAVDAQAGNVIRAVGRVE